jgi:hypothetical protein
MIVTFKTQPGVSSDYTGAYLNFLRCVTAIMTAPAGTTSLTVNPYTASNTINTGVNCIVSIDSNTEAGGWLTSSSHTVPSSLSNTPATYNPLASAGAYAYRADFYKASPKTNAAAAYMKMCFHSYNTYAGTAPNWMYSNSDVTRTHMAITDVNANAGANMLITYGHSSSTNWTDSAFPPAAAQTNAAFNNLSQQKSHTLNSDMSVNAQNNGPGLCYMDTGVQYKMAVTADYCIIWEEQIGVSYTSGQWQYTTSGTGTTYWGNARYGSIYYMGLRDTQSWENNRDDNPPWVVWQQTINRFASGVTATPYAPDAVVAYMAYQSNTGVYNGVGKLYTVNSWNGAHCNANNSFNAIYTQPSYEGNAGYAGQGLDPVFRSKNWGNTTTFNGVSSQPAGFLGNIPQVDPTTGTLVPGAYPMVISKSTSDQLNQGGKCKGIYKSLSMPWASMKNYWQSLNQTFTIGSDTYIPIVIFEDMWLVRVA